MERASGTADARSAIAARSPSPPASRSTHVLAGSAWRSPAARRARASWRRIRRSSRHVGAGPARAPSSGASVGQDAGGSVDAWIAPFTPNAMSLLVSDAEPRRDGVVQAEADAQRAEDLGLARVDPDRDRDHLQHAARVRPEPARLAARPAPRARRQPSIRARPAAPRSASRASTRPCRSVTRKRSAASLLLVLLRHAERRRRVADGRRSP